MSLDNGREFYGPDRYIYESVLQEHNIDHIVQPDKRLNGFILRLRRLIFGEFMGDIDFTDTDISVKSIQVKLSDWTKTYNSERSLLGYPNYGTTPLKRIIEHNER